MEYGNPLYIDTPLGTLSFNVQGGPFWLNGGTLGIPRRSASEDLSSRDGSFVFDTFRGGATPVLQGHIRVSTMDDRAAALDELRGKLASIEKTDGYLRFTPTGGIGRQMTVRLFDDPNPGGDLVKTFQIALKSGNAYAESQVQKSIDTSTLTAAAGGTFVFPISFPVAFGDPTGKGNASCSNDGNVATFPIVRIYGAVTAPTITNVATGQRVSLPGLTLASGDYAEIDMNLETITLNGAPDYRLEGKADFSVSEFFALVPGVNSVTLSAASFDAGAKATILYRDAYA
jgi:hypothetical protein